MGTKRRTSENSVGRKGRALLVVIAMLAAVLPAVLLSGSAGAQLSPCNGGDGDCTKARYVQTRTFTGDGSCEWTHRVDWGDGNVETIVKNQRGPGSFRLVHRYSEPGVYTVRVTGSGRPLNNSTRTCDFTPSTTRVEVVPASAHICLGRLATIVGTSGADTLSGTAGPDIIVGLGGNDTINGRGGNDRICAGAGRDTVNGGGGVDGIDGGKGADTLRGGSQLDVILGKAGNDRMFGNNGGDFMQGGSGKDLVDGGKGNDVLEGNKGDDRLRGRAGNDTMDGGAGNDSCKGHGGRDTRTNC